MDLSIIIVNWNTADLLARCLESIFTTIQYIEFETIVVDNSSTDSSKATAQRLFPQVRIIENEENVGFARANNQAIRASHGRYILLLNSDAFLQAGAVQQLVAFMDHHPEAGIVGANLVYPDGRPQFSHGRFPTLLSEVSSLVSLDKLVWNRSRVRSHAEFIKTEVVSGACLMIRRSSLDQIGLLDERFFMFSEEVDLCYRAYQAGWKIYHLPSAQVIHIGGGSTGHTAGRILLLYRGKLQYFTKHYGPSIADSLWKAMQFTAEIKVIAYSLLRYISLGRLNQDQTWREVSRGLG